MDEEATSSANSHESAAKNRAATFEGVANLRCILFCRLRVTNTGHPSIDLPRSKVGAHGMCTALAYKPEYDEAPVSSTEVLGSNVIAIRGELIELKTDFKQHKAEFGAAVARVDTDIKAAVARLDDDIKAAVAQLRAETASATS
ncbi:MAG: hypothetical protein WDO68_18525 [Gammaproteobacteria bacterium]